MPTEPDEEQPKENDQPLPETPRFSGVRKYVENNDIAGLMRELDKVDTNTKEAILNKISMSDGRGGRIELDGNQMIPMPDWMLKKAQEQIKKSKQSEQEDATLSLVLVAACNKDHFGTTRSSGATIPITVYVFNRQASTL